MIRHFSLTARAALLGAAAMILSGCGGGGGGQGVNIREVIGVDKNPPDAFAVVRHGRDLEVPPSLEALPQPNAGARSRMRPNPQQDAIQALRQESANAAIGGAASYAAAAPQDPTGFGAAPYAAAAPQGSTGFGAAPYAPTPTGFSSAPYTAAPTAYTAAPAAYTPAPAAYVATPTVYPASSASVTGAANDAVLLNAIGAGAAPQDIRTVVDAEAASAQAQRVEYPLERVMPILRDMRGDTFGAPLDPLEEYRRSGVLPTQ